MNQKLVELIIANVARVFIFFISSGLYIFLLTRTIPQLSLKHRSVGVNTRDRGIKKYTFEGGRAVVYEPELIYRKYVPQYMLLSKNRDKFIRCRINPQIRHIKYDVVVYDNRNKLIDIIGVEERVNRQKYTTSVLLPPETSYARLILRRVDNMYSSTEVKVRYSTVSIIVCAALIIAATVALGFCISHCFTDLWQYLVFEPLKKGKIFIHSSALGAIVAALILRIYMKKNVKVTNR